MAKKRVPAEPTTPGPTPQSRLEGLVAEYLGGEARTSALRRLKEVAGSLRLSPRSWEELRGRVVLQVRERHTATPGAGEAISDTSAVLGALDRGYREGYRAAQSESRKAEVEVLFGPLHDCRARLVQLLEGAVARVDACVFTITNDHLANALVQAARRGVAIRVITEGDKVADRGSDIDRLRDAGIDVRRDTDPECLMHHKFVIVDRRLLATGSMNWTYSAVRKNYENLVVSGDPDVVNRFREEYERIWDRLLPEPPAGGGHP